MRERLAPELAPLADVPPISLAAAEVPRLRALEATLLAKAPPPPEGVTRHDYHVPSPAGAGTPPVLLRIWRPAAGGEGVEGASLPAVLYIHGGGGVAGSVGGTDSGCATMARDLGCLVASVEYRLAPEHPYPAAVDDCYAALCWLAGAGGTGAGGDPGRVGVVGNSSGGGLAACLALMARDRGGPRLMFQVLIQPMLDHRNVAPASDAAPDTFVWSRENNRAAWGHVLGGLGGAADEVPPYASAARAASLAGLPPAYVAVGELDLFLDESMDYARRLIAHGVATELHVYPGAPHGFQVYCPGAALSARFNGDVTAFLARALG